jgi:hypothetical protein
VLFIDLHAQSHDSRPRAILRAMHPTAFPLLSTTWLFIVIDVDREGYDVGTSVLKFSTASVVLEVRRPSTKGNNENSLHVKDLPPGTQRLHFGLAHVEGTNVG